jgi:heterodisulfide reductase subunit C
MFPHPIPDPEARSTIERSAQADVSVCWTCSTCDSECPIFRATGRLRPQKVVRMANLGFLEDLLSLPEIWYCLRCKRCNQVCPNLVKPAALIRFLRNDAIRRNLFSWEWFSRYRNLFLRFQRVRWHAAEQSLNGEITSPGPDLWRHWLDTPIEGVKGEITLNDLSPSDGFTDAAGVSDTRACFNCSECSNACPIFFERSLFDPQWIFRMVNLGLEQEILGSPSIWLCIGCQRCTDACGEGVKGHLIIQRLQELALAEGAVDKGFPFRWKKAQETIYPLFLEEIDALLGANSV